MKLEKIEIQENINKVKKLFEEDSSVSPEVRAGFELLLMIISLLINRLGLNSANSSIPPSQDPNREKQSKRRSTRNPGGQKGRKGSRLLMTDTPDQEVLLGFDERDFPLSQYPLLGYEKRQVWDLDIRRVVTEYQAEIRKGKNGERLTADFPEGVTAQVQYGSTLKAHAVYLSQYQFMSYQRVQEYFHDQVGVPLSQGSLSNFIQEADQKLDSFETLVKEELKNQV